jgi:hypothetical protein
MLHFPLLLWMEEILHQLVDDVDGLSGYNPSIYRISQSPIVSLRGFQRGDLQKLVASGSAQRGRGNRALDILCISLGSRIVGSEYEPSPRIPKASPFWTAMTSPSLVMVG